jgi:hypothetical protein
MGQAFDVLKDKVGAAKDEAGPALDRAETKLGEAKDKAVAETPRIKEDAAILWGKMKEVAAAAAEGVQVAVARLQEKFAERQAE